MASKKTKPQSNKNSTFEIDNTSKKLKLKMKAPAKEPVTPKEEYVNRFSQSLVFEDTWLKNRRNLLRFNLVTINDLYLILQGIESGKTKLSTLRKDQASDLLQEVFWLEFIKSYKIREAILKSIKVDFNILKTKSELNRIKVAILNSGIEKKVAKNKAGEIIKSISSSKYKPFSEGSKLRTHPQLSRIFFINAVREIGKKNTLIVQLTDQENGQPLPNYRLHIEQIISKKNLKGLGSAISDESGLAVIFLPSKGNAARKRIRLKIQIVNDKSKEELSVDEQFTIPQTRPFKILVPSEKKDLSEQIAITKLSKELKYQIPKKLLKTLENKGIKSLKDIKRTGSLRNINELCTEENQGFIQKLDAHTHLWSLTTDLKEQNKLIEKEFLSPQSIARTPLMLFVKKMKGDLGEIQSIILHRISRAQSDYLQNVITGARADFSNYGRLPDWHKDFQKLSGIDNLFEEQCECKDCDAAVSPRAYLADLIDYAIQTIYDKSTETPIDLDFITSSFYQPLGELPASCEAINKEVRQVRICVEVLRAYLKDFVSQLGNIEWQAWKETQFLNLMNAEKEYNLSTYSTLLNKIGTSYSEMRQLPSASEDWKESLAERLGLHSDLLPSLLLEPDGKTGDQDALDEFNIERIFGISDTRKHPLFEGAKTGDHRHPGLMNIKLEGVKWNENTDINGIIYATLTKLSADEYQVELFREKDQANNVAYGKSASPEGTIILIESNESGITGKLDIRYTQDNSKLEIPAVPEVLSRREGQIKSWKFDNVEWNKNTDENGSVYVLLKLYGSSYGVSIFRDKLLTNRVAMGSRGTSQGTVVLAELGHSGLRGEVEIDYIGDNRSIEISLIPSFLAGRQDCLRKIWKEQDWLADLPDDEQTLIDPDVISPQDFRTPLPEVGAEHPANAFDLWIRRRLWVDQTLLEFSTCGLDEIENRTPVFDCLIEPMKTNFSYGGQEFGPCWPADYDPSQLNVLHRDLKQGKTIEESTEFIQNKLRLTLDSFNRLIEIRNKEYQYHLDPRNEKVTKEEWHEIFSILTQARKRSLFSIWRQEETALGIPENFGPKLFWTSIHEPNEGNWPEELVLPWPVIDPEFVTEVEFLESETTNTVKRLWQARKAQLELIKSKLKKTYLDSGFNATLKSALGDPNVGDPLPPEVRNLKVLLAKLDDTDPAVVEKTKKKINQRLFMSPERFRFMMNVKEKAGDGEAGPTEAELERVYDILAGAEKVKRAYPVWLREEKLPKIDPTVVKFEELSETATPCGAKRLWQARQARLEENLQWLIEIREDPNQGFEAMLRKAFGEPFPYDLDDLSAELGSGDSNRVNLAIRAITEDLCLTVEEFDRLMINRTKDSDGDVTNKPTTEEYSDVYKVLQQAQKTRLEIPAWVQQEESLNLNYWNVYKAKLPQWRASYEHRQQWQQALQIRYQSSIIDPDIIGMGDLQNSRNGILAGNLLRDRNEELIDRLTELETNKTNYSAQVDPLFAFDGLLLESLFDNISQANVKAQLKTIRESSDFTTLMWLVFKYIAPVVAVDEIYPVLKKLLEDLLSGVPKKVYQVKRTIRDSLFLAEQQFERIMQIKEKEEQSVPISEGEWEEMDAILAKAQLVGCVMGLEKEQKLGFDIVDRLKQYGLTNYSFDRLKEIRNLLILDANVQKAEWTDVYSILLQVVKKRNTVNCCKEEKKINLLLSQDFFKILDSTLSELTSFEPVAWRSTYQDRREWVRKLETRIEQEQTLISSVREIISSTEETHLPSLRNALISIIGEKGNTFEEKQQWLTDHLIIDTKTNGCQTTTRISEAITTLQNLIWLVRTGQFKSTVLLPDIDLGFSSVNFDEEWKWMGSYAMWRAAMFVFIYPENILLPTLRTLKWQSPAFQELVKSINKSRSLTHKQTFETANKFTDYFRDICNLKVEATCQAKIKVANSGSTTHVDYKDVLMMFAISEISNKLYWSTSDVDLDSSIGGNEMIKQTFWKQITIEPFKCITIIGAVPYELKSTKRYIFLFLKVKDDDGTKLGFKRFDLDTEVDLFSVANDGWKDEITPLALPEEDLNSFDISVGLTNDLKIKPILTIQYRQIYDGASINKVYVNTLNDEGKDLSGSWMEWFPPRLLIEGTVKDGSNNPMKNISLQATTLHTIYNTRTDNNGFYRFPNVRYEEVEDIGVHAIMHPTISTYIRTDCDPQLKLIVNFIKGETKPEVIWKNHYGGFEKRMILSIVNFRSVLPTNRCVLFLRNLESGRFEFICGSPENEYSYKHFHPTDIGAGQEDDWQGVYPFFIDNDSLMIGSFWMDRSENKTKQLNLRLNLGISTPIEKCPASDYEQEPSITSPGIQIVPHSTQYQEEASARSLPRMFAYNHNNHLDNREKETVVENFIGQFEFFNGRIQPKRVLLESSETVSPLRCGIEIFEVKGKEPQLIRSATQQALLTHSLSNRSINTLLKEVYLFVPVFIALQLQKSRQYTSALDWFRSVYDFEQEQESRKIYYGLIKEESLEGGYERLSDWLLDPLNPHAIASMRPYTYTRFTLLSIIKCMLDYADNEFTFDTGESVPRARKLYETALHLLNSPEINQSLNECENIIIGIGDNQSVDTLSNLPYANKQEQSTLEHIKDDLRLVKDRKTLDKVATSIRSELSKKTPWIKKIATVRDLAKKVIPVRGIQKIGFIIKTNEKWLPQAQTAVSSMPDHTVEINRITETIKQDTLCSIVNHPDLSTIGKSYSKKGIDLKKLENELKNKENGSHFTYTLGSAIKASLSFCIPPNPVINTLRLKAQLNLLKIRTCRNIAGMERELEPYAAPTDTVSGLPSMGSGGQLVLPGTSRIQPTPYRYQYLIERAKQLAQLAAQMEASMLAALEKRDAEYYNRLKAQQDIELARGQVNLQNLRVKEAEDGVTLAELQKEKSQVQIEALHEMLDAGLNQYEQSMIYTYRHIAKVRKIIKGVEGTVAASKLATAVAAAGLASGVAAAAAAVGFYGITIGTQEGINLITAETSIQTSSLWASYERRKQEWEYQQKLASHELQIGNQGLNLAKSHKDVVEQEKDIADMQTAHANEVKDFLASKFTNVELYDWMSKVLEGVYSYFLQQATSVAKLAYDQIVFERQEVPPSFIQTDYWTAPSESGMSLSGEDETDRRGLTGSARLLQDIYILDQYAFETNKRKLQLVKTISLSRLAPAEFQLFRQTGKMNFMTPMILFDQDFPGHYLRLVKRIRTSVIALIPSTEGIKASLSTTGHSRVVVGPDVFQTVNIRRSPQSIALTSPVNATGLFELDSKPEMLYPFEGTGVDTTWEFRMPKSANRFNYDTIADVLLTIEYTALESYTYRQQVIQELDSTFRAERAFSIRDNFPDQWYHLHHPQNDTDPIVITFKTHRSDFPVNLSDIRIEQLLLAFGGTDGNIIEVADVELSFTENGNPSGIGGTASTIEGSISTRKGNAASWIAILGKQPIGKWQLNLPNTPEVRRLIQNSEISDILFVISFDAITPQWPV